MIKKISLLIITVFIGYTIMAQTTNKQVYNKIGSKLPKIEALTVDSLLITNKELQSELPVFVIIFSPTCGHCINAGKKMAENATKFNQYKVLFYTYPLNHSKIAQFMRVTGLEKYDFYMAGADQSRATVKISTPGILPQINVYKNERLIEILHSGNSIVNDLSKYLKSEQNK